MGVGQVEAGPVVRVQGHNPGGRPQQLTAGWAKQAGLFSNFVSRTSKGAGKEGVTGGSSVWKGVCGLFEGWAYYQLK